MKQTAVEWLVEQLNGYSHSIGMPLDTNLRIDIPKETIEKAKEMEEQQIIEAYIAGSLTGCGCYNYMKKEDGEEYYKQKYGGKK
jgi:HEPN domain-containing protein